MPALTFILAFVAVLALIGLAAWLVRRFAGNRLGANPNRGRMPRLAVIDAAAVDGRRRLVLVRRDNVEHLLMIGGPTDIVVEPNIVRATAGAGSDAAAACRGWRRAAAANLAAARCRQLERWRWLQRARPSRTRSTIPSRKCPSRRYGQLGRHLPRNCAARCPAAPERRPDPLAGFTPEPLGRAPSRARIAQRTDPSRLTTRNEPVMPRSPRLGEAPKAAADSTAERPVAAAAADTVTADTAAHAGRAATGAAALAVFRDVERRPKPRRDGAAAGGRAAPACRRAERTACRCAAGRA